MPSTEHNIVHVAVALIKHPLNPDQYLLAKRPLHVHQGGLWEFPGGKVEFGEDVTVALARELQEELAIRITQSRPLFRLTHHYPDKSVCLDIWCVTHFDGTAIGAEGQAIQWVKTSELSLLRFPKANQAIIAALRLSEYCVVTPEYNYIGEQAFFKGLESCLSRGYKQILFRSHQLDPHQYREVAHTILEMLNPYQAKLLLNADVGIIDSLPDAQGLHLSASKAAKLQQRPISKQQCFTVACHNLQEMQHAQQLDVDAVFVSPVLATQTHPNVVPLGWERFAALCWPKLGAGIWIGWFKAC